MSKLAAVGNTIEFVTLPVEQLTALIRDAVKDAMGKSDAGDEYLTLDQAAELLQTSTKTVRAWIRNDGLPAVRAGSEYRIRRVELVQWLESRAVKPGVDVSKASARLKRVR